MKNKAMIKIGRGHDADIRVTDISVSRFHAKINYCDEKGEYFLEDNNSKFGTLVLVRKPIRLQENKTNYFQMGRTLL
jgi:pSer/pThr/pTyr-binding forkhead associated (FHA) protein